MAYTDKLRVVYGDYTLGVHGEGFDYIFYYKKTPTAHLMTEIMGFSLFSCPNNPNSRNDHYAELIDSP